MKLNLTLRKWVIVDKARTVIAKGVPRNRYIVHLDDKEDKKRIMYYSTKKKAESAMKTSGFYGWFKAKDDLEPVEVDITIKEI